MPPRVRVRGRAPLPQGPSGRAPHIVVDPLRKDSNSKYSLERRILARIDCDLRRPTPPAVCYSCQDPQPSWRLYVCYADEIMGEWRIQCRKCRTIITPTDTKIPEDLQDLFDELIEYESGLGISGEQVAADDEDVRATPRPGTSAAEKAAKAAEARRIKDIKNATNILRQHGKQQRAPRTTRATTSQEIKVATVIKPAFEGERSIALVYYNVANQGPQCRLLKFPDCFRCDLGADPFIQKLVLDANCYLPDAQWWDVDIAEWDPAWLRPAVTRGTPALIFRVKEMRCPHFGREVRMLEENAAETDAGRKRARNQQAAAYAEAIAREHYEGYAHICLWNKDAEGPQSFVVKLGADRTFALDGNQGLREALGRNYDGCVLVWERSRTDWKRYALDERVGVPDDDHTVLMRIPDLLGLPYLGVEMCAQELKVDWVIVEDPRHPENHGGRAARQPLEMQNPVKQEVDIDLVAEEEREISTRLAEATIREDDRVLLDVDLFCNL